MSETKDKCTECGKELDGSFHFKKAFHGQCQECHEKYGKNCKPTKDNGGKVNE